MFRYHFLDDAYNMLSENIKFRCKGNVPSITGTSASITGDWRTGLPKYAADKTLMSKSLPMFLLVVFIYVYCGIML